MNVCTPMPDGSLHCLTPHEAQVLRGYLLDRMVHVDERDQHVLLREVERLKAVADPMAAYEDWGL
ncbi:MAG TPA: hypothetical protein VFK00_06035 [Rhodanobacteraceae bacterium]|nr:hypothetical protein [Rhodanobacteraceae bacterium]